MLGLLPITSAASGDGPSFSDSGNRSRLCTVFGIPRRSFSGDAISCDAYIDIYMD
jgi:hypothetical protein